MEKEILEKLKRLRLDKGYTTSFVASKLHIEEDSYKKMEAGVNHSFHKYQFDLFELLGTNSSEFYKEFGAKNIIHQENKDNATGIGNIEKYYADNSGSIRELYQKDEIIEDYKRKDAICHEQIEKKDEEIEELKRELELYRDLKKRE